MNKRIVCFVLGAMLLALSFRTSLSILIFLSTGRLLLLITIGPRPFSSQGTRFLGCW